MSFASQNCRLQVEKCEFHVKFLKIIFFSKHSWLVHARLVHSWLLIHLWLPHRIWVWLVLPRLWVWIIHPLWSLSGWSSLLKQNSHFLFVTCIFWSYHANPNGWDIGPTLIVCCGCDCGCDTTAWLFVWLYSSQLGSILIII